MNIHHDDLIRLPNGSAVIDFSKWSSGSSGPTLSSDVESEVCRGLCYLGDDHENIHEWQVSACRVTRNLILTLMPDRRLGVVYKLDTGRVEAGYYFTVLGLRTATESFVVTVFHNYVSDDAIELQYLTNNQQKP